MICGLCEKVIPEPSPLREDFDSFSDWDDAHAAWARAMKKLTGLCRCRRCERCQGLAKRGLGLMLRQDCKCPQGTLTPAPPRTIL